MTIIDTKADLLPITALIPEDVTDPVVIYDETAALRFAVVERDHVKTLASEWDEPGIYLLLDLPITDGTFGVYVGKAAPGGVRSRLLMHLNKKDHWYRALIIRRDTTHGFNSAQVGWLEGRLYDLMYASVLAQLHNGNRPMDETLPPFQRAVLEASILPIRRVLRLLGHDVSSPEETVIAPAKGTKAMFTVSLVDLIQGGYLTPGAKLVSTHAAWPATAEVIPTGIAYDGNTFTSPSGAGKAVKGGNATNGWDFWAVETESGKVTLATLRARYLAAKSATQ